MIVFLRLCSLTLIAITLSACQFFQTAKDTATHSLRIQGTLSYGGDQWRFEPCTTQAHYRLVPSAEINEALKHHMTERTSGIFADLRGTLDRSQRTFSAQQLYRLQTEGHACNDSDFPRLLVRASGHEPDWSILQTPQGLIFNQADQPALVLPYIEEQLPDGRFYISSEANNQDLQLWITPQQCTDSMSGTLYHLSVRLQWNQQTLQGCAAYGALRD